MSNLPPINNKHKVCVICEGFEDVQYFKRLMQLDVWNSSYEFIPINAKGAPNIFACYQDAYSNDRYEVVLIFCDTDKKPFREYQQVKKKIKDFHDGRSASNKIIIFANPCTMQIILSHFGDVCLKNQGKKTNSDVIEKLTGVKNYDAHEDQIKEICNKIFQRTYPKMKERIEIINFKDDVSCSTNFIDFASRFENDNLTWIKDINKYLQK